MDKYSTHIGDITAVALPGGPENKLGWFGKLWKHFANK
jgi:hypothetical protein